MMRKKRNETVKHAVGKRTKARLAKMALAAGLAGLVMANAAVGAEHAEAAAAYVKPNLSYESEPMPAFKNPVPVAQPLWTADLGRPNEHFEYGADRVAAGGGKVFYLKEGVLTAADVRTGKTAWTYGKGLQQPVAYDGGDVFAFGGDGTFHRIDAATGKAKWTYRLLEKTDGAVFASPPVFDGQTVYVYIIGGLFALDRESGRLLWTSPQPYYSGSLLVAGGLVLVSTVESGAITIDVTYALDKRTGETVWRSSSHPAPLLIADGRIYAQNTWPNSDGDTHQFRLDEVDLATGETVGQRLYVRVPEGGHGMYYQTFTAAADESTIFIQAKDGTIHRFDYRIPGDEQQPKTYSNPGKWIAGPYNNKLFFEKEGGRGIEAVKILDGTRAAYEGPDNPVSRLDFHGTGMFVGQTDGHIYALNVATGKALFRYRTDAANFDPFHVENGILLAQAESKLYAFALPEELLRPLDGEPQPGVNYVKAEAKLVIDGVPHMFDPVPVMIDNRMYVPLRALYEAAGARVHYDEPSGNVYVYFRDRVVTAPQGVNIRGAVYVPIREAGTALGISVEWDGATRTVHVDTGKTGAADAPPQQP